MACSCGLPTLTKICSFTGWQSQTVFPALTDNHHFPEFVSFSSARRYFGSSEAGGVDLHQFLEWFFGSDYSLKTNIMLRSSGSDFHLIDNSIVLKCFPEQHWKRIYSCFYFESLLISCRKGCVLMLQPRCPYYSGSFTTTLTPIDGDITEGRPEKKKEKSTTVQRNKRFLKAYA